MCVILTVVRRVRPFTRQPLLNRLKKRYRAVPASAGPTVPRDLSRLRGIQPRRENARSGFLERTRGNYNLRCTKIRHPLRIELANKRRHYIKMESRELSLDSSPCAATRKKFIGIVAAGDVLSLFFVETRPTEDRNCRSSEILPSPPPFLSTCATRFRFRGAASFDESVSITIASGLSPRLTLNFNNCHVGNEVFVMGQSLLSYPGNILLRGSSRDQDSRWRTDIDKFEPAHDVIT